MNKVDLVVPVTPVLNEAGQVMTSHRTLADAIEAAQGYPEGDYTYTLPVRIKVKGKRSQWVPAGIKFDMSPDGVLPPGWYGDAHGVFAGQAVAEGDLVRSVTEGVEMHEGGIPVSTDPDVPYKPMVFEVKRASGGKPERHFYA